MQASLWCVKVLTHCHQSILKGLNQGGLGVLMPFFSQSPYLSLAAFSTDFKGVWSRISVLKLPPF